MAERVQPQPGQVFRIARFHRLGNEYRVTQKSSFMSVPREGKSRETAPNGSGIYFDQSAGPAAAGLEIRDVNILNFCGDSVFLNTAITSTFANVRCQISPSFTSTGYAFHVLSGTSLVFDACYANGAFLTGYYLDGLHYSALNGCAADGTNRAYYLNNCQDVALTGPGARSRS
jgi:hypothetical protein